MKTKFGILAVIISAMILTSCGRDSETGTNEAAVSYFNAFLSHDERGDRIGNDLALTTTNSSGSSALNGGFSSFNTLGTQGQLFLRLFRNGTYALFSVNQQTGTSSFYNNDNTAINTISGNWKIEADKLILEGLGESQSFNAPIVNTGLNTNFNSQNCFLFTVLNRVAVPVNGQALGANNFSGSVDYLNPTGNTLGFNSFDVPMFCKQ